MADQLPRRSDDRGSVRQVDAEGLPFLSSISERVSRHNRALGARRSSKPLFDVEHLYRGESELTAHSRLGGRAGAAPESEKLRQGDRNQHDREKRKAPE